MQIKPYIKLIATLAFSAIVLFVIREALPKPRTIGLVLTFTLVFGAWIEYWIRTNRLELPQRICKIFLWIFYASLVGFFLMVLGMVISPIAFWSPFLRVYGYGMILVFVLIKIGIAKFFLLQFLLSKISFTQKIASPKRWFQITICITILAFSIVFYGLIYETFNLRVHRFEVRNKVVPEKFDGYKIVQFSDMHIGSQVWNHYVKKLVDSINAQNPDLVVFTGDMVNFHAGELAPFVKIFSQIQAKDGVFVVLGNHDYSSYVNWKTPQDSINDFQKLLDIYDSMGWRVLRNEHVWLRRGNDSIVLAGVENYSSKRTKRWENLADTRKALRGVSPSNFIVMISHNPEHFNEKLQIKFPYVNLTLTGHSHGGQIAIGAGKYQISISQLAMKHWRGFHQFGDQYLNVCTGAGFNTLPFRFNMPPSISVITLKVD